MSDWTSISDLALAALITYGPLALALTLLLGAAGLPLPGGVVLLAAGAFARQGFIDWRYALLGALVGVVIGDSIAFAIGHAGGAWAESRFTRMNAWNAATDQFTRRGGWAIFLTRFLITPLGVAVSVIAGISGYAYPRFLAMDAVGEVLWITLYGGIGFALGSQWQAASQFITDFSGLILGVALLITGVIYAIHFFVKRPARVQASASSSNAGPLSNSQPGD